jgi:hypothetical protein
MRHVRPLLPPWSDHMPLNLCNLSLPVRLLFSGYLLTVAIGYGLTLAQILFTHSIMTDGKFEPSLCKHYGNPSGSILESELNGSMRDKASSDMRIKIIQWAREGGEEHADDAEIQPLLEQYCLGCPDAHGGMANFAVFDDIGLCTRSDEGTALSSLIQRFRTHIFDVAFVFVFVGLIFALSTGVPCELKCALILMPYGFFLLDIASWWLTQFDVRYAFIGFVGGSGLALTFVFMWAISMYEMWVLPRRLPDFDRRHALTRCCEWHRFSFWGKTRSRC